MKNGFKPDPQPFAELAKMINVVKGDGPRNSYLSEKLKAAQKRRGLPEDPAMFTGPIRHRRKNMRPQVQPPGYMTHGMFELLTRNQIL
jgi:hypothetical protein